MKKNMNGNSISSLPLSSSDLLQSSYRIISVAHAVGTLAARAVCSNCRNVSIFIKKDSSSFIVGDDGDGCDFVGGDLKIDLDLCAIISLAESVTIKTVAANLKRIKRWSYGRVAEDISENIIGNTSGTIVEVVQLYCNLPVRAGLPTSSNDVRNVVKDISLCHFDVKFKVSETRVMIFEAYQTTLVGRLVEIYGKQIFSGKGAFVEVGHEENYEDSNRLKMFGIVSTTNERAHRSKVRNNSSINGTKMPTMRVVKIFVNGLLLDSTPSRLAFMDCCVLFFLVPNEFIEKVVKGGKVYARCLHPDKLDLIIKEVVVDRLRKETVENGDTSKGTNKFAKKLRFTGESLGRGGGISELMSSHGRYSPNIGKLSGVCGRWVEDEGVKKKENVVVKGDVEMEETRWTKKRMKTTDCGKGGLPSVIRRKESGAVKLSKEMLERARVINQVDRKFIFAAIDEKLVICIDQHAADERIRLEMIQKSIFEEGEASEFLSRAIFAEKIELTLTDEQVTHLYDNRRREALSKWLFDFTITKGRYFLASVPVICGKQVSEHKKLLLYVVTVVTVVVVVVVVVVDVVVFVRYF